MSTGWDIHTHLVPGVLTEMAKTGRFGMTLADTAIQMPDGKVSLAALGSPPKLLERIASDGLAGAMVAVPPPVFRADIEGADRAAYVRDINQSLLQMTSDHERLLPVAFVPAENPGLAAKTILDLEEPWVGTTIGTQTRLSFADRCYDDLWAALVEKNMPVLLHPADPNDPRLAPYYLTNLLGNPYETTLAAAQIIFGDVFARYPDLKVILSHGGGATCALVGRWQRGYLTDRPGIVKLQQSPMEAVRCFYADSVVHSEAELEVVRSVMGQDRILLGSDWPFPMGTSHALDGLAGLSDSDLNQLRVHNVKQVFNV